MTLTACDEGCLGGETIVTTDELVTQATVSIEELGGVIMFKCYLPRIKSDYTHDNVQQYA